MNPVATNSQALRFYQEITGAPSPQDYLRALVKSTPPTFETEWRDFKGAKQLTALKAPAEKQDEVKRLWSEALSGFANTQGGVLVWGIDARKDSNGIDAAGDLSLVQSLARFKTGLLELHGEATDPPVQGVEIEAFPVSGDEDKGFVVCYVPESSIRPHRAEHAGRTFYIRAGDDFRIASVSLLRALFYPMSRAYLEPRFQVRPLPRKQRTVLNIVLLNRGTATAKDISFTVRHDSAIKPSLAQGIGSWAAGSRVVQPIHRSTTKCLHPGEYDLAVQFQFVPEESLPRSPTWFSVDVFSQDCEPRSWRIDFKPEDFKSENDMEASIMRTLSFEQPFIDPVRLFG